MDDEIDQQIGKIAKRAGAAGATVLRAELSYENADIPTANVGIDDFQNLLAALRPKVIYFMPVEFNSSHRPGNAWRW